MSETNLKFLLSASVPKPLLPVAGHPIILHHIRALSSIVQITNLVLIGRYTSASFKNFMDVVASEYSFKSIQYIQDLDDGVDESKELYLLNKYQ